MAIVGTAFVRLRVIGDKLKSDISKATQDAVEKAAPELGKAGEDVGDKIVDGVGEKLGHGVDEKFGKVADSIGDQIGRRMAENLNKSLRVRAASAITNGISSARGKIDSVGEKFKPAFDKFGERWAKSTSVKFSDVLKKGLVAGIGAAITVLPSALAFAGSIAGALVSTIVPALAAIGPAAAGAGIAAVAAMSAIKISAGLVGLALKTTTPALDDFKKRSEAFKVTIATPIQAGLLSGLNAGMRITGPLITAVKGQLEGLGTAVGDVAIGFANMVTQGSNISRIQTILANNNIFVTQAGAGVTALGQAFIILLSHLGPVIDYLGSGIQLFGEWAAQTILASEASGTLDSFIKKMFDSFLQLAGIAYDFGVGLFNVFHAALPVGQSMLGTLNDIAAKFREWTSDTGNQARMTAFFEKMRTIAGQVFGILRELAGVSLGALENTDLSAVTRGLETLRDLGPPIAKMFDSIKAAAGDSLADAFTDFVTLVTNLADAGVIGHLATAFSLLFKTISALLAIPGVGQIIALAAGLAVMIKTVRLLMIVFGPIVNAIMLVVDIIGVFVSAFGAIPVAIFAVVAGLIYFFGFTKTGRALVMAAVQGIVAAFWWCRDAVVAAFEWVVDKLGSAWNWITEHAGQLWNSLVGIFNGVKDSIVGVFDNVLSGVQGALGAVVDFIVGVWDSVYSGVSTALGATRDFITGVFTGIMMVLTPILSGIGSFFATVFNGIRTVVEVALNIIYQIFIRIFPLLLLPIRIFYGVAILLWQQLLAGITLAVNAIWLIVTTVWNAIFGAITMVLGLIWAVVTTVWNAVWGFIVGVMSAIWSAVTTAWNAVVGAVSTALAAIWAVVITVWNAVWGFIIGVLSAIGSFVAGVWNGIVSAVGSALSAVWGVVRSVWNTVSSFIGGVLSAIGDRISSVWHSFTGIISGALNSVMGAVRTGWNAVVDFVQGALDRIGGIISNIWGGLENVGSGIVSGLKSALNGVIGGVNQVIGGINSAINLANKLPGPDIPTIPTIPKLAKGGIAQPSAGGTLAIVAEAGRPERIEPLDAQGLSKRDHAILNVIANGGGGEGRTGNVNVFIGTGELARLVDDIVVDREDSLADRVLTGTKG